MTVIIPFSRPDMIAHVWSNLWNQTTHEFEIVVVENGKGIGAWKAYGVKGCTILESENHPASAKNVGLEYVKKKGGKFTIFDDDDWYGRNYIHELMSNQEKAIVVGKRIHLVEMADGIYLFDRSSSNQSSTWVHGPTICCQSEDAIFFPIVKPNDDKTWCKEMRKKGATFYATSIHNYIYIRLGHDHVWKAPDWMVRLQLGDAIRYRKGEKAVMVKQPTLEEVQGYILNS